MKTRASTERRSQGSWRCFFFNNLGKLRPKQAGDGSDRRFKDALRRRFLRQVPLKIKKEEEEIIQIENYDFQGHIKLKLIPSSIFTTWSENLDVNLTLGSVQYPVSQRISMVAEKVIFLDPFDKRLFQTCMSACSSYDMIQLIEFLISGYLLTWLRVEGFDNGCCGYLSTDVHVQGGTFHR